MRPRDLAALEFEHVRNRLADFAGSPGGKEACRALWPANDRATVQRALETTWECLQLIEQHGNLPLGGFPDIRAALRSATHEGFILDGKSLLDIRTVLAAAQATRAFLRKQTGNAPNLVGWPDRLTPLPALQASLERALDEQGGVTDDASDELAEVRRTLRQLRDQLTRRLDDLLARPAMAAVIADRYVTIRNNRFVIPIKAGAAAQFDGVVQDRSASGETMFIEPLFAVDMNNRLLMAARDEEALVRRVLADLTALVRTEQDALSATYATLVELDALTARARFAQHYRCTQAELDDEVVLRQARHPMLLFAERDVTPVDLLVPPGKQVLVLTGPNTGGKTVAVKTLGLLALMTQSGMLIPVAEGSRLPCFRAIYADVGDEQSIERNLSTFSAHVANLTEIIEQGERPALVLLDEPGMGTDPDEGAALGIGMIRTLAGTGAMVAVTTHYTAIKVFALSDPGCVTAAVEFDVEALVARYRLTYHSVGESLALPIARRLGLPTAVLDAAQAARSEHAKALATAMGQLEESRCRYEERLAALGEQTRATTAAQHEAARLLEELREKRRRRWTDELTAARDFVRALRERGHGLLAAIERGEADRRALSRWVQQEEAAIREREATLGAPPAATAPPRVGDQVRAADTGIRGVLASVQGERAWVQRGSLRFEVPAAGLRRVDSPQPVTVAVHVDPAPEATPEEISLLGLRAKEAVAQLERFLDRAARARHPSVRIIHGIGSGALKRAVEQYLSTSRYCAGFRAGEPREGGAGVTVADLATG
jgi:DNA mismatch repair protein MutS2